MTSINFSVNNFERNTSEAPVTFSAVFSSTTTIHLSDIENLLDIVDLFYPVLYENVESVDPEPQSRIKDDERIDCKCDLYKSGSGSTDTCPICHELFKEGENVSELQCSHTFHQDCINRWGKLKDNCPICRAKLASVKK